MKIKKLKITRFLNGEVLLCELASEIRGMVTESEMFCGQYPLLALTINDEKHVFDCSSRINVGEEVVIHFDHCGAIKKPVAFQVIKDGEAVFRGQGVYFQGGSVLIEYEFE